MSLRYPKKLQKKLIFCKHLHEMIVDETKAPPSYKKLGREGKEAGYKLIQQITSSNAKDERKHKKKLTPIYNKVCRVR